MKHNDPGYSKEATYYRAYHSGSELLNCHTADEEIGYAVGYLTTNGKHLEILDHRKGILREYIVLGKIEVRKAF